MWPHTLSLLLPFASGAVHFQVDPSVKQRVEEGKAQLEKITTDPSARGCWATAVERLQDGCKGMDDAERSKLAVLFTNCHLEKSGLETYSCTDEMSVAACTQPMVGSTNSLAYHAYTQFFTHAESMCFYLQSSAFQAATEQAVDKLHASARGTAARLGELQEHAGALVDETKAIRVEQEAASEAAAALRAGQVQAQLELATLSSQQEKAFQQAESNLAHLGGESQAALAELRRGTDEIGRKQGTLLGGLDRVLSLQGTFLGEVLDIKSVFVYVCAVLLALALTATQATASARLPLFVLLTANLCVERCLATCLVGTDDPEALHRWISLARRIASSGGFALLAYAALHHTDVGKQTLSALDELKALHQQATDEMQERLQRLEKEAAAIRSRESSLMALQAQALRKQKSPIGGRRALSPLAPPSGVGVRRAISPLVSKGGSSASKRQARSPPSKAAAAADAPTGHPDDYLATEAEAEAGSCCLGSPGLTATVSTSEHTTATSATATTSATGGARPPSPPESDDANVTLATASAAAVSSALAVLSAGMVSGGTPSLGVGAAKGGRRRSSIGSTESQTDNASVKSLTPTRRSARLASRQQPRMTSE